jgi:hypothetical protein
MRRFDELCLAAEPLIVPLIHQFAQPVEFSLHERNTIY